MYGIFMPNICNKNKDTDDEMFKQVYCVYFFINK